MSLRTKLFVAFGGPLAILMVLGIISVRTITESSSTLERIFRENYDSVAACLKMKDAVEAMDRGAEIFVWDGVRDEKIVAAEREFAHQLKFQQGNITLPGEQELTASLTGEWNTYRTLLERFFTVPEEGSGRREFYRNRLLPQSEQVLSAAQRIIDINLSNMVSADGQVRRQASETNRTMILLILSGVLLAVLFIGVIGPSIIRPISRLTRSVQEIRQGNLDLFVRVGSKDEIGKLAEAFNEMTSSLREFRRTNRARLLRTEKATLSALNSLSDAIAIGSPDGEIELSNETAVKMFSLAPGSSVGESQNEKIRELFARAVREMRPIRDRGWDSAIQNFSEGEERFFLPEAIPIFDDQRGLVGVTLVLSDVTGLRQLDEVKSGLISTVSHELKTPLTSIRLATHALLSEKLGPLSPQQTELVAAAREDSDRLYRIIENLLDIGRMESGRSKLELAPMDAAQIVFNVAEDMRTAFADRGVSLVLDLPGDVPRVLADRLRLEIVLTNLLDNSLKYTPPGGQVKVSAHPGEDEVLFSVEDTGKGIPGEYLPHIFEKFFRVPGYEQQGNSGLGLAIVKEIIEAHGSTVGVSSDPGKGTIFTFALKQVAPASSDNQTG